MQYANEHLLSQPGCTNTRPGQLHAPITQTILTTPAFIDNPPHLTPELIPFPQPVPITFARENLFKFLSIRFEMTPRRPFSTMK